MLLADSHYGSQDCLARGAQRGVTDRPNPNPKGKLQGHFTLEDFELAEDGHVLSCPQGARPQSTSASNSRLQVLFDEDSAASARNNSDAPPLQSVAKQAVINTHRNGFRSGIDGLLRLPR